MSQASFGRTWWGKQWLNALHEIDYSNRLPRGRRYANNGSVHALSTAGGSISASVQGSRRQPYKVKLEVPALDTAQSDRLLDALSGDPALLAGLLNRQLDPAVLEQAQQLDIPVFPRNWQELDMHCSCPDWAVPCKHLAAVIYLLSREIDSDPFLVFQLRGIDLLAALHERGQDVVNDHTTEPPTLAAALRALANPQAEAPPDVDQQQWLTTLDCSTLPDLIAALPQALPAEPALGRQSDYRKLWHKQMKRIARQAKRQLDQAASNSGSNSGSDNTQGEDGPASIATLEPEDRPVFSVDSNGDVRIEGCSSATELDELVNLLNKLNAEAVADLHPEISALYALHWAALHLTAGGAAVPWVLSTGNSGTAVLWLPASLDPQVDSLIQELSAGIPDGVIRLDSCDPELDQHLDRRTRVRLLCGLFLDYWIREWSQLPSSAAVGDKVADLLFGGGCCSLTGPGEVGTAASLHNWLARLHWSDAARTLLLRLEEPHPEQFELSLEVIENAENTPAGTAEHRPLAEVLSAGGAGQGELLRNVSMLADAYPPLHDYLRDSGRSPVQLQTEQLPELLFNVLPTLQLLGVRTLLPRTLERLSRPQASMQISAADNGKGDGFLSTSDLFSFDWRVAIGDAQVDPSEFAQLVEEATGLVRFRGQYVYLDPQEVERLRKALERPPQVSGAELTRIALAGEYQGAPVQLDESAQQRVAALYQDIDKPTPGALQAQLRPYQQRGFQWLYGNVCAGLGCVIADDMGLGKTVQVISLLLQLQDDNEFTCASALVVVPTSLLSNWLREFEQFAPGLTVSLYHGAERALPQADQRPEVMLTTYGVVRSDANRLRRLPWRLVVVDEAHNLKNPQAAQTKAVKSIPAGGRVAMSGTPVENRLTEYWSLMDFCNPGYLGTLKRFTREFVSPIQTHGDQQVAARFRRITAPFLLRRLKSDKSIITDLPDKIEQDQLCQLTTEQSALYESVVREGLETIQGTSDTFKRQGLVLQMILALKQICNHPRHYLKEGASAADASGKVQRLLELLGQIQERHEKAIIFTQFREAGELLQHWINEAQGRQPAFLHGGLARKRRDEMVSRFEQERTERVMVLSLKAAGTGLNLTAASQVIHFDLWWNPAVEAQATDRAYRIGQSQTVQVHRLLTQGTFEERINEMIQSKRALTEMTVESGEQWIGNLSDKELSEVFSLNAAN